MMTDMGSLGLKRNPWEVGSAILIHDRLFEHKSKAAGAAARGVEVGRSPASKRPLGGTAS